MSLVAAAYARGLQLTVAVIAMMRGNWRHWLWWFPKQKKQRWVVRNRKNTRGINWKILNESAINAQKQSAKEGGCLSRPENVDNAWRKYEKKKTVFHLRWLVTMRTRIHAHIQKCVRLIQLSAIFVFKDSDKDKSKLKTKMPHYPTFRHSLSFLAQFLLMQSLSAAPPHSHNYFNKLFDWIFKMLIFHITASKLSDRVQPQACWVKWSRKW